MRSNCLAFAWREYRRRYAEWQAAGMPPALHPWLQGRPSKSAPHEVLHWTVGGWLDAPLEFVPLERRDVPWWLAWTRLVFRGRVRRADFPNTEPSDHAPL
jgi:hypothetical protein